MPIDAWPMDAAAGAPSYSGQDLRMGTVVPFMAGAGASLGVRSGVRLSGSGTDLLVQAQASPNMTVKINPGVIVVQGSISATQGAYTWALDTTTNLTIAAAHATLARTDLVVVRIRDAGVDTSGARDGGVIVITGTAGGGVPSLPADATYMTIAQVAVGAAVASIVAGNITDKRQYTAALGAPIPCLSTVRPAGLPNQRIIETDTGFEFRWDGSKYMRDPVSVITPGATWTNTTTKVAIPGLSVVVEANSKYAWRFYGYVTGNQNIGAALGMQGPTGATLEGMMHGWGDSAGAILQYGFNIAGTADLASYGYNTAANQSPVTGSGTITTVGTAGSVTMLGAQRVANAIPSTIFATSWLELRQIA